MTRFVVTECKLRKAITKERKEKIELKNNAVVNRRRFVVTIV